MTHAAEIVARRDTARVQQIRAALDGAGFAATRVAARDVSRQAAVVVWTDPLARSRLFPAGPIHVVDLVGTPPGPGRPDAWRAEIVECCRGASLVLVGSEAELGFWSAACDATLIVVPPGAPALPAAPEPGRFTAVLEGVPGPEVLAALTEAAAAIGAQNGATLVIRAGVPGGLAGLVAARTLRALPHVTLAQDDGAPIPPGILLDLRADTAAERVRTPPAVMAALAQGLPVLSTVRGALTTRLVAAGAGLLLHGGSFAAAISAMRPTGMGEAAAALARTLFDPADAARVLTQAIADAVQARQAGLRAWHPQAGPAPQPLGPDAHVLVLSNEHANLVDIRVHLPFGAMHRRGAIGGYTILHEGKIAFSTRAAAEAEDPHFDAIWVHRAHDPRIQMLLRTLDRPFAYDLDDNLLATPSYRDAFPAAAIEAVRGLMRRCAVLSCSTEGLAALLQDRIGGGIMRRTVVTPNLATRAPAVRVAGLPRAVVWASSDLPALTGTRDAVERAVRDFCAAHRLRLVCLGAAPSPFLAGAGLEIEHVGILPHAAYLEYLRALSPAILVCPLETAADAETQDFVNGKSDVKALEAGITGLVGVYSDAAPYRHSDLAPGISCANTYEAWLDGLEQAYRACGQAAEPAFPPQRMTASGGLLPWAEALGRARLPGRLFMDEVTAALRYVAQRRGRFLDAAEFDEQHYIEAHPDVAAAVQRGELASGYGHYGTAGYAEGRDARARNEADGAEDWWTTLIQTVSRLEEAVDARALRIERMQAEHALRRSLTR